MTKVYVVIYTKRGRILKLAQEVVKGIEKTGVQCKLFRTIGVHEESPTHFEQEVLAVPTITAQQLVDQNPDGLILGTPGRFGGISPQMSFFLEQLSTLAVEKGTFIGKVASSFTSSGGLTRGHGGHETGLILMASTCLHLGFVVAGVPSSPFMDKVPAASPYGVVFWGGTGATDHSLSEDLIALAQRQGEHVAKIAKKLSA